MSQLYLKEIAALIPHCTPESLGLTIVTISERFPPGHRIVVAFNKGPNGLTTIPTFYAQGIVTNASAPGELCYLATQMTRDLRHPSGKAWGMEIHGPAIIFYLEPGKHFWSDPDFPAMLQVNGDWGDYENAVEDRTLNRLTKTFVEELHRSKVTGRTVDAFFFPAFEMKPRVVKVEFDIKDLKDDIFASAEYLKRDEEVPEGTVIKAKTWAYLGLGSIKPRVITSTPSHPLLERPLKAYWFDRRLPRNKSIITEGNANYIWGGNVLVLAADADDYADVKTDELSVLTDHFTHYVDAGRVGTPYLLASFVIAEKLLR
jgi:hypothetical protein